MADDSTSTISRLRGLLEVTRLVRSDEDLPELLAAIARTVAECLGFRTVCINLYRPAWDDFCVMTVYGNEAARAALLDGARRREEWEPLLDDRFLRRGAYHLPHGAFDWSAGQASYVPAGQVSGDPEAWHPEDALFAAMRHGDGHVLGIVSVDEPASGRRPTDEELDVLVAVADHAAIAVQHAQDVARGARHRGALEHLLRVSTQLSTAASTDVVLESVCTGIRDVLGFANASIELVDAEGRLHTKAAVGWALDDPSLTTVTRLRDVVPLLDPEFEVEGCYLLPSAEAEHRVGATDVAYSSRANGRGPHAWSNHWLLVPIHDRTGAVMGMIWADEPRDRLLPTRERLQALRMFANQCAAAFVSAEQVDELRFHAEHDALTRLPNRRAFVRRLDAEVARAGRYGRRFALVLCDLDGFKAVNDRLGHQAGDDALRAFADVLRQALRRPDDAFRIGGDEFAVVPTEAAHGAASEVVARVEALLATSDDPRLAGLGASFGIAVCPQHARDAQALFRAADQALYDAKRAGGEARFAA
ncbi:MAG TPA: diguanylate cyclase [Gaiellaceae bacterium]